MTMVKLYRHQEIALSYMRSNNYFALFMEQGTGKTIPSLCRILDLLKSGKITDALVVAPKSALGAWERDIELFNDLDREILRDSITLINYDKIWRNDEKSPYYRPFGCIVLDEAHSIKNRTSQRSKFLLKIACLSKYRYILTGTPIGNGQLENIYSLYCFLDPYIDKGRVYSNIFKNKMSENASGKYEYKGSYGEFQSRYCILNMYHKPSSYINVKELQKIINEYSYRVKKVDCLDLPEKLPDEVISVELKEKALYKRLHENSALLEYEILAENPLSRMIKLRQLCAGHLVTTDGLLETKTEKLDILKELIEGYEDDKKLVIFAEFKYSIRKISDMLVKMGVKYVILDGDQKDKTIWRQFQSDKSIRVIVCQYQTASAGIDLFASDTIIYYEMTLRSTILEQSRDRIHRTGQKNKCSYLFLITKGTIEEAIYKSLVSYQDFSEKLFLEYMNSYRRSYSK